MGIDRGIYVGPYVECKVETVQVTKVRKACSNAKCDNHARIMHAAFCNVCGCPVKPVEYTATEHSVDQYAMVEAIDEELYSVSGDAYSLWSEENNIHLWKPNTATGGREKHLESREDFAYQDITPELIALEIASFLAQFTSELDRFRQAYGDDAVQVKWGVIQDYS
jgi:hypothetical protein